MTSLEDHVWLIDTMALGVQRVVAAYLVRGKDTALIDMGYRSSARNVIDKLSEFGIGRKDLNYLLPTHVHLDHSGSCGVLAKEYPEAAVRVHPIGARHLVDPSRLWDSAQELFGAELADRYGRPEPVASDRVKSIKDEEAISLGDGLSLRAIWTPGHASHHLSYLLEEEGIVFTGDAIGVFLPDFPFLIPTTPPPSFDMDLFVASLEKFRAIAPSRFCTPHYGVLQNAQVRIDENIQALRTWNDIIQSQVQRGSDQQEIAKFLLNVAIDGRSRVGEDVPDHVRVLVVDNVRGYLQYLARKTGREPRGLDSTKSAGSPARRQ